MADEKQQLASCFPPSLPSTAATSISNLKKPAPAKSPTLNEKISEGSPTFPEASSGRTCRQPDLNQSALSSAPACMHSACHTKVAIREK
eukprot:1148468-Pelagomonas_calceolata.AAC.3